MKFDSKSAGSSYRYLGIYSHMTLKSEHFHIETILCKDSAFERKYKIKAAVSNSIFSNRMRRNTRRKKSNVFVPF